MVIKLLPFAPLSTGYKSQPFAHTVSPFPNHPTQTPPKYYIIPYSL